jgi:hypothetical protein
MKVNAKGMVVPLIAVGGSGEVIIACGSQILFEK